MAAGGVGVLRLSELPRAEAQAQHDNKNAVEEDLAIPHGACSTFTFVTSRPRKMLLIEATSAITSTFTL